MSHILLVDDEAIITLSLGDLLESQGHRVTAAHDGLHGIEAMRADPADLAIVDLNMPVMDGSTLIHLLKQEFPNTKIGIMTGLRIKDIDQKILAQDLAFVCLKPVQPLEFIQQVNRVLDDQASNNPAISGQGLLAFQKA